MLQQLMIVLFCLPLWAQAQSRAFTITGHSDFYNGRKLGLQVGVFPLRYNGCSLRRQPGDSVFTPMTQVVNGSFTRAGTLRYPHPLCVFYFDAATGSGHGSYFYFIEGGNVHIDVKDLASNKALGNDIRSAADAEYRRLRKYYSSAVDTVTGAIPDLQAKQRLMRRYISAHPGSYVALWDLVLDYPLARTDAEKRSLLENTGLFSASVKRSATWRALTADLDKEFVLVVGKAFPDIALAPSVSIRAIAAKNKYTLVDFWYSHCRPCLEQAPALKDLYLRFKDRRFGLLGVSVDKEADVADWRAAIGRFALDWPQYLDVNGLEAGRIRVNSFPANFLLDGNGVILKKDLSPEELASFLEARLPQ